MPVAGKLLGEQILLGGSGLAGPGQLSVWGCGPVQIPIRIIPNEAFVSGNQLATKKPRRSARRPSPGLPVPVPAAKLRPSCQEVRGAQLHALLVEVAALLAQLLGDLVRVNVVLVDDLA